jgi:hypothetical protein
MSLSELEEMPLHDATLKSVEVLWREAQCRLSLRLSSGDHLLTFSGVTLVTVPRKNEWGRSVSINSAQGLNGVASIEMQSGDIIEIAATEVTLSAL